MQTITMRELRDMFAPEAEADTVTVETPSLNLTLTPNPVRACAVPVAR